MGTRTPGGERIRRYPILGGVAALRVPVVAGVLVLGAVMMDGWALAAAVAGLGVLVQRMWRSVVTEVSPVGLSRGFLLKGTFIGRTTVLPWQAVTEIHTDWCRPGDDTALVTVVRGRDGTAVSLSTAMGTARYWACLADVVASAPGAVRSGLTDAVLADGPPDRRHGGGP